MSWEQLKSLASSDESLVSFIDKQIESSNGLVQKVQTLETTNSGLLGEIKNFKLGNNLVKESLGLEQLNQDTLTEALNKLKSAKGDEKLTSEITNLKTLLEKATQDKELVVNDYESKLSDMALTNSLRDLGLGGMVVSPIAEKLILDQLKAGATRDGDNIVYRDDKGATVYNGTNVMTPQMKLKAMQEDANFKPFFKADVNSGAGTPPNGGQGSGANNKLGETKQDRTNAIKQKYNLQ